MWEGFISLLCCASLCVQISIKPSVPASAIISASRSLQLPWQMIKSTLFHFICRYNLYSHDYKIICAWNQKSINEIKANLFSHSYVNTDKRGTAVLWGFHSRCLKERFVLLSASGHENQATTIHFNRHGFKTCRNGLWKQQKPIRGAFAVYRAWEIMRFKHEAHIERWRTLHISSQVHPGQSQLKHDG